MRITQSATLRETFFDSVEEFFENAFWIKPGTKPIDRRTSVKYKHGFHLTKSQEENKRLALHGWEEGRNLLEKYNSTLEKVISEKGVKIEYVPEKTGLFFDVGLVLSGIPECWFDTQETEIQGAGIKKIVRLGLNIGASSAVASDEMIKRGATTLAMIHALELGGFSVELTIFCAKVGSREDYFQAQYFIPVKQAGEVLEIDRLAYLCCHPDVFRRGMFNVFENEDYALRERLGVNSNYGFSVPPIGENAEFDILVPNMFFKESDSVSWIIENLKKQGIQLNEA